MFLYAALFFDNTVSTTPDFTSGYMPSRIVNAALMQQQLMIFIGGCIAAMTGVILLAVSALSDSIKRNMGQ